MLRRTRNQVFLNYYKRYKCPECNEYSLRIFNDTVMECKNECDTTKLSLQQVVQENEFKGFFTREELENDFYLTEKYWIDLFFQEKYQYHNFKQKEGESINAFFRRTSYLEQQVDEIVIQYLNRNSLTTLPNTVTPFGYLVHLVEEIHYFINRSCKDLRLADIALEINKQPLSQNFFSGRFFFHNAIENLWHATERIWTFLGIHYDFAFSNDFSQNKVPKIKDFIKKDEHYKKSKLKEVLGQLLSNNSYRKLDAIRKTNTHDLSFNVKECKEAIQDGRKTSDYFDRDANDVDLEFYLSEIRDILFCIEKHYELLEEIIYLIQKNILHYELKNIPMIQEFLKFTESITPKEKLEKGLIKLKTYKIELLHDIELYQGEDKFLILDVFFRLEEASRCLIEIFNVHNGYFYFHWERYSNSNLRDLIDEQYLLYSSLLRIYSCFDKISRYLSLNYGDYSKIKYFADLDDEKYAGRYAKGAKEVIKTKNYQLLHSFRNDIYHNLRVGGLYGEKGMGYHNHIIWQICFGNIVSCYEYLKFLVKEVPNQGRNALCKCGSGRKFKKCCLNV
ncbi:YecA family protein [Bacillus cereus group sp. BfR-BA-01380]|uniref:YecA family protein n=1 Tax=Bacillus cereus group sp. BfR-BA-01380 TaxID=2920324 RepID=UPI001F597C3C|nr:SEC-C domain-containing protein [Bacillus cereus group sp. BfR-BA-01380]